MEFQFGTNWARFSRFAGGVIGQTLAMEGMFAFFLESRSSGLFLFGEKRLSPRAHLGAAFAVFAGSWLSGYFIVATDAWMQHPVGYGARRRRIGPARPSFSALLLNRWALWQYLHTMCGALVTGAFVTAGLGAYYLLRRERTRRRRVSAALLKIGVIAGLDRQRAGNSSRRATGRASSSRTISPRRWRRWRGCSRRTSGAPLVLIGQPNTDDATHRQPARGPERCSASSPTGAGTPRSTGLDDFPPEARPDNIALLYYSYHLMVGPRDDLRRPDGARASSG